MARLAIARGFLAEYAKLQKDVQSAVDAACARFARHPYPGMLLEKPQHSRDGRMGTIRVNGSWRGVVLAPPGGDTYCLVTVLPPSEANAYAANHRFSVNRAVGVLEVREKTRKPSSDCNRPSTRRDPAVGGCSGTSATPT